MHPPPPSQTRSPFGPPAHPQGMQPPSNQLMSPTQQHTPLPSVPSPYSPSMQTTQLQPPGPYVCATPPLGPLCGPGQPLSPPGPYTPSSATTTRSIRTSSWPSPAAAAPWNSSGSTGPPGVASAQGASNTQPPRSQQGPPPPKYSPGDQAHIHESVLPIFNIINKQLTRMKQTTQPQQRQMANDLECQINSLFDALNCETLSKPVVDQLLVLARAMEVHDQDAALSIHVDLLTRGSQTDNIGLWMLAIKQLIICM
ncbi:hypothetical protein BDR06DRAFT_1003569 [Suillus hirtellus]|nr:hypothetical protein BDR06DRAFT_1003569 [Suillus hirtellus]